jgi:hypothetical protein
MYICYLFQIHYDSDGDGNPNSTEKWTYDADENNIRHEYDTNGNGNANRIKIYSYDATGNRIRYEDDSDADGSPNSVTKWVYDANGNQTKYEIDSDGDGNPNQIKKWTYNANGKQVRYELDRNGDGKPNEIIKWSYDANGNQISYEIDSNGDGIVNFIEISMFDANGNKIFFSHDPDGNGIPSSIQKHEFINKLRCTSLGAGLAHKILVNIPESGLWSFGLCGSDFSNIMALDSISHCDSSLAFAGGACTSGDASFHANLDSGIYYLTILGKGLNDFGNYKLNIQRLGGLGTEDIKEDKILIYPNPATNSLTIKNVNHSLVSYYEIYASDGKKMLSIHDAKNKIDISSLGTGVYFIKVISKNGSEGMNSKFVKVD